MLREIKKIKSKKSDLQKFGVTIGIILIVIAGFLYWKENELFKIFFNISIVFCIIGVAIPSVLKPIYKIWMSIAIILGWFMSRVILSMIFYLLFTPLGLLGRIFGNKFLDINWNKSTSTYWNNQSKNDKSSYLKQY